MEFFYLLTLAQTGTVFLVDSSVVQKLIIDNSYIYAGTDGNGVWKRQLFNCNPNDIKVLSENNNYIVYPNPALDFFTIDINIISNDKPILHIYNIMGSLIKN